MSDESLRGPGGIAEVKDTATQVLEALFANLKAHAQVAADEPSRLFFPNGIELISVSVKVTPIEITLTVAGAKGVKSAGLQESATA